jgi:hypothetical protein
VDPETLPPGLEAPPWQRTDGDLLPIGPHPSSWVEAGRPFELVLSSGVVARGVAVGPEAEPLPRVQLSLRHVGLDGREDLNHVLRTAGDGSFESASLPPGRWHAYLYGYTPTGLAVPDPVAFELGCDAAAQHVLTLRFDQGLGSHGLIGRFVDTGEGPVAGLCMALWADHPGTSVATRSLFQPKAHTFTDEDGTFELAGLPAGRFLLGHIDLERSRDSTWVPQVDMLPVEVGLASPVEVEWITEHVPTGGIRLSLEQDPGQGSVIVRRDCAHRAGGWVIERPIEFSGVHELTPIPSGAVRIELEARGQRAAAELHLEAGATAELALVAGELILVP